MLDLPQPQYTQDAAAVSADALESIRQRERARHESALGAFQDLQRQYQTVATDLRGRVSDQEWSEALKRLERGETSGSPMRRFLARVGLAEPPKSTTEVLERQLEAVQDKIYAVARLRESLDGQISALDGDIRRLNTAVIDAAHNEEQAAAHVLALNQRLQAREEALLYWDLNDRQSARYREAMAEVDELKAQIRAHGVRARGFGQAENRLASIVRMNRSFLEMLRNTAENMEQLAAAAQQVVGEISGNLAALTKLTLANEVACDLMTASRQLKDGINKVAKLASDSSLKLTRDIDGFVSDMRVYDEATIDHVEANLSEERRLRQAQVEDAIAYAWAQGAQPAEPTRDMDQRAPADSTSGAAEATDGAFTLGPRDESG